MSLSALASFQPHLEGSLPLDPKAVAPSAPQRLCTLPNGLEIACQSAKETEHIYDDIFAHRVYLSHGISLWDGACVFDVGGNIGLFTVFLHQTYRHLRTYTFEPAPPLFEILHYNAARYGGDCKLFRCGISDTAKNARLTFYPYSSGMSSFHGDEQEEKDVLRVVLANQEEAGDTEAEGLSTSEDFLDARFTRMEFDCPLRPLSQILEQEDVESIDLLKIDVQKSELEVLQGLSDADWPKVRQIAMEVHDLDGELATVRKLLEDRGYRTVVEQDPLYAGSVMYNVFAVDPRRLYRVPTPLERSCPTPGRAARQKQAFARRRIRARHGSSRRRSTGDAR